MDRFRSRTPSGAFNEVRGAGFRIEADDVLNGRLGMGIILDSSGALNFTALSTTGTGPGSGTHRSRIKSDGTTLTFDYDQDFNGTTFTSDFTHSIALASLTGFDSTNSHLYFGGTANATYDDISISVTQAAVPEPTTLVLLALGLLGISARRRLVH